jgi:hypothetical protein
MTKMMIVMLIWGAGANGGPAVLPGFATMQACNASITIVQAQAPVPIFGSWRARCVELPTE